MRFLMHNFSASFRNVLLYVVNNIHMYWRFGVLISVRYKNQTHFPNIEMTHGFVKFVGAYFRRGCAPKCFMYDELKSVISYSSAIPPLSYSCYITYSIRAPVSLVSLFPSVLPGQICIIPVDVYLLPCGFIHTESRISNVPWIILHKLKYKNEIVIMRLSYEYDEKCIDFDLCWKKLSMKWDPVNLRGLKFIFITTPKNGRRGYTGFCPSVCLSAPRFKDIKLSNVCSVQFYVVIFAWVVDCWSEIRNYFEYIKKGLHCCIS